MIDIVFYDVEVFKYDWTVTFKSLRTGEYTFIHNNNYQVKEFMRNPSIILCGWNSKMYDDYILSAMIEGADNYTLKQINDWIIGGNLPWEHPFLNGVWRNFKSFDVRDDLYQALSLKEAEGNMGMNIEESSISFDIDRPLTKDEVAEVQQYNKHDVDATERVFKARKQYLRAKIHLGRMIGLPDIESLRMTNGKLSARFLNATKIDRNDERDLVYPTNLIRERIPTIIFDFYDKMLDPSISDDELFKDKLKFDIKGVEYVYGFGGVHAGVPNYQYKSDKLLLNYDVRSLYPSIMIEYNLLSRNTPIPERFKEVYYERIKAKSEGNREVSEALKLVLS